MQVRTVKPEDYSQIDELIRAAFTNTEHGYGQESELVNKIRTSDEYVDGLELVVTQDKAILGYGLLSEVHIKNEDQSFTGLVLAPLAVRVEFQKKGVGRLLIKELEKRATKLNYRFISILGHPSYYPKFNYVPVSEYNVRSPFSVPDEAFMIKPLFKGALDGISGTVRYSKAFD